MLIYIKKECVYIYIYIYIYIYKLSFATTNYPQSSNMHYTPDQTFKNVGVGYLSASKARNYREAKIYAWSVNYQYEE